VEIILITNLQYYWKKISNETDDQIYRILLPTGTQYNEFRTYLDSNQWGLFALIQESNKDSTALLL
jgi:hypothetical protein